MYAGHAALATLAKGARPRVPIGLLVPVAFAPDWIQWVFDAIGRGNREISHSLVSVAMGATLVALLYLLATRQRVDAAAVWLTYASHWPADYITGLKPTWPGGPTVGLHLYTRPFLEFCVEAVVIIVCWCLVAFQMFGGGPGRSTFVKTPVNSPAGIKLILPRVP